MWVNKWKGRVQRRRRIQTSGARNEKASRLSRDSNQTSRARKQNKSAEGTGGCGGREREREDRGSIHSKSLASLISAAAAASSPRQPSPQPRAGEIRAAEPPHSVFPPPAPLFRRGKVFLLSIFCGKF
jgi:hypothetical protein